MKQLFSAEEDHQNEVAPAAPATAAAPTGRLLKRAEVAARLGVSVAKVRRMEGAELRPIVAPNGIHWFVEEEIEAVVIRTRRTITAGPRQSNPEGAVQAFRLFEAGRNPADVVRDLRVEPEPVEEWHRSWRRLRLTLLLKEADMAELRRLFPGVRLDTEQDLLVALERELEGAADRCKACRRARAYYCPSCARKALEAVRAQDAAEKLG